MPTCEIVSIYLSPNHDFKGRYGLGRLRSPIHDVPVAHAVAGRGLSGDRFFDHRTGYRGQVTFIALEVLTEVWAQVGSSTRDASAARRNVVTEGLPLEALIGRQFRLGSVLLEGTEECAPCFWMNEAIGVGAEDALRGRGGLRARILTSGPLAIGRQSWSLGAASLSPLPSSGELP